MAREILRDISTGLFGVEGDTLFDGSVQAMVAASGVLITGVVLLSPLISDLAIVFDISEARAGLFVVAYTASAAVTLPVTGVLADRVGRKRIIVTGLVLFGLAGGAFGSVSAFGFALVLRGLQGVGFAAALPNVVAAIGDLYTGARETTVQSIRLGGNSIVNVAVPTVAGLLFVISWRYPFVVYLLALPVAGWIWVKLPPVEGSRHQSLSEYVRELSVFLWDPLVLLLLLTFFVRFVLFYGMLTYISVLAVREAGLAVVFVGTLVSLRGVALFLGSTQVGRLVNRIEPELLAIAGYLNVGLGIFLMGAIPIAAVLVAGVLLQGIGDGLIAPTQLTLVNRIVPDSYRGATMSAAYTSQTVGMVVGPAAMGVLLGAVGPAPAFALLGAVGGTMGLVLMSGVWLWRG